MDDPALAMRPKMWYDLCTSPRIVSSVVCLQLRRLPTRLQRATTWRAVGQRSNRPCHRRELSAESKRERTRGRGSVSCPSGLQTATIRGAEPASSPTDTSSRPLIVCESSFCNFSPSNFDHGTPHTHCTDVRPLYTYWRSLFWSRHSVRSAVSDIGNSPKYRKFVVTCCICIRIRTSTHPIKLLVTQFIDPERMKGWVGLVGKTYSGRLTHICGHPSAAGRAWDRESSPVYDRRSTTVPRSPTNVNVMLSFVKLNYISHAALINLAVNDHYVT